MQIEFLGTGGATVIPRPGCTCRVCAQARVEGVPYSRTGPSVFLHGIDVLIDTPAESALQLARARVEHVRAAFYTHWHPDHTMGRRVWEMNIDWRRWPPQPQTTDVYVPAPVAEDFRRRLGIWEHLTYLAEELGLIRLTELRDGEAVAIDGATVRPIRLAQGHAYAFLVETASKRVLIAMDELRGWMPPEAVQGVDVAVVPMGVAEFDLLSGERRMAADHIILALKATFEETLDVVRALAAGRVVMHHIEEFNGLSYDDLLEVERQLAEEGMDVTFAYDTLQIDVS